MNSRARHLTRNGGLEEAKRYFTERAISHLWETKSLIIFGWVCNPRDNPAIGIRGYECARAMKAIDHATACVAGDYLMDCHVAAQLLENRTKPGFLFADRIKYFMGESRIDIAQRMVALRRVSGHAGWNPISAAIREFFAELSPDVGPAYAATVRVFDETWCMKAAIREIEQIRSDTAPADGELHQFWRRPGIDADP
jgi:hypothetical protein